MTLGRLTLCNKVYIYIYIYIYILQLNIKYLYIIILQLTLAVYHNYTTYCCLFCFQYGPVALRETFRWSSDDLSLKKFVKKYSKDLPVLVMTTSGYAGADGHMHEIGIDEVSHLHIFQNPMYARYLLITDGDKLANLRFQGFS